LGEARFVAGVRPGCPFAYETASITTGLRAARAARCVASSGAW
jgi:hypothetical protein